MTYQEKLALHEVLVTMRNKWLNKFYAEADKTKSTTFEGQQQRLNLMAAFNETINSYTLDEAVNDFDVALKWITHGKQNAD